MNFIKILLPLVFVTNISLLYDDSFETHLIDTSVRRDPGKYKTDCINIYSVAQVNFLESFQTTSGTGRPSGLMLLKSPGCPDAPLWLLNDDPGVLCLRSAQSALPTELMLGKPFLSSDNQ